MVNKKVFLLMLISLFFCSSLCIAQYQDENVSISFKRAYRDNKDSVFFIELSVQVLSTNKIIWPKTYSNYWYANIKLVDNFGNSLGFDRKGFMSITPRYYGTETEVGLRPSETEIFTIKFNNIPLPNTEYLILTVPPKTFGNINQFEIKIDKPIIQKLSVIEQALAELEPETKSFWDDIEKKAGFSQQEIDFIEGVNGSLEQQKQDKMLYSWTLIGLCVLSAFVAILFLFRKIKDKISLLSNNVFPFLSQWKKQKYSHFLVLQILSALICLVWFIIGIVVAISERFESLGEIFYIMHGLILRILIWLLLLWVGYFIIFGILRILSHITIKPVVISGMIVFLIWCLIAFTGDLYFRQFFPIALAILVLTGGLMYLKKKPNKQEKSEP